MFAVSQFAAQHSANRAITYDFVAKYCGLPVRLPNTIAELIQLENIFDVMDIYLWLRYRFIDMYPHYEKIRSAQGQLDDLIKEGVAQITKLIQETASKADSLEDCSEL